ncbi:MAG: argininosuccinate lyase [Anaerococcus sp.]
MQSLWGGRFQKEMDELMEDFHASIDFDKKLYKQDIQGSIAHVTMLGEVGIIKEEESESIIKALLEIEKEIENGAFVFGKKHEDIHMNIENALIQKIGDVGKKLHTARSRNDQVALDLKLYIKKEVKDIQALLKEWIQMLIIKAEDNLEILMPGYTHLQRAQPISLSHWMLAHAQMAKRDYLHLSSWIDIHNTMPLGSGALAGTTYPIDRDKTAELLDFDYPSSNSMDGVSDRDYVLDILYYASTGMMHLSRLCEEIVMWSSKEFDFILLDDAYSTGSSMMPQKKNPDAAELIRGKTGRVYGDLITMLTVMKSLPLAYNKDMQEDKEALFDGIETWKKSLKIIISMVKIMQINSKNMMDASKEGFTNATDLADYLVKKGVPFRDAHKITGEIVLECIDKNIHLEDMSLEDYKKHSSVVDQDLFDIIGIKNCVMGRNSYGGTSPEQIKVQINELKKFIEEN